MRDAGKVSQFIELAAAADEPAASPKTRRTMTAAQRYLAHRQEETDASADA